MICYVFNYVCLYSHPILKSYIENVCLTRNIFYLSMFCRQRARHATLYITNYPHTQPNCINYSLFKCLHYDLCVATFQNQLSYCLYASISPRILSQPRYLFCIFTTTYLPYFLSSYRNLNVDFN